MILWFIVLLILAVPVYTFIRMIRSLIRKSTIPVHEGSLALNVFDVFVSIGLYILVMIGFYFNESAVKAGDQLIVFEATGETVNGYASLANDSLLSLTVLLTLGIISYWIMTYISETLSPIIYVLCSTLLISNIFLFIIYLTHTGFKHDGDPFSVILLQLSFLSLTFLFIARLKDSLHAFLYNLKVKDTDHSNVFIRFLYILSNHYRRMTTVWAVLLFPLLVIVQLILVLFGQRPDSFIRVFLDTSSFNYSIIPAPAPQMVEGDGHYLCTVSAKGHKKLVKPIRAGIRHGQRIPVNRQLLIANAFENILEQYTPNLHESIRQFYDQYGYPISRHIHSKWSADLVYIIMKPLEWIFLVVLYTVDKKPENRIHIQYSELRK